MKVWLLSIFAIITGLSCGVGSVWSEFVNAPQQFEPNNQPIGRRVADSETFDAETAPQAFLADGTTFDFGTGPRGGEMEHEFSIANMGVSPLTLELGTTSCKCTFGDLQDNKLQPGQATAVKLSWKLSTAGEDFRQSADILTNDPQQRTIVLEVYGKVTDRVRADPADVVLSNITKADGATGAFDIYAFDVDNFKILRHNFTEPSTAEYYELSFTELSKDQLPALEGISAGVNVKVRVKPGLQLGAINQTARIVTSADDAPDVLVPIRGTVTGDISVAGTRILNETRHVIDIGKVDQDTGAEAVVRILVKGPRRNEVDLEVASVNPKDLLEVAFDDPNNPKDRSVHIHTLRVNIPAGARAGNHLGSDQGELGEIVISTTHPDVETIPIYVRFAVK